MRRSLGIALTVVGALFVAAFAWEGAIQRVFALLRVDPLWGREMAVPIALSTGLVGAVLVVSGLLLVFRDLRESEVFGPYRKALFRLAAEHGQAPTLRADGGLGFTGMRDGYPFECAVYPAGAPAVQVRVGIAGRLSFAFLRVGHPSPSAAWLPVGGRDGWELQAELPALARRLLADQPLLVRIDRYFARAPALAVVHDLQGLYVTADMPADAEIEALVRDAIGLAGFVAGLNAAGPPR